MLAEHLSLKFEQAEALGENDRSATGFLPPDEFERVADQFFASPSASVRGWERALDAQARIVKAIEGIAQKEKPNGAIAIVSHGAVGGGNYFSFTLSPRQVHSWWRAID